MRKVLFRILLLFGCGVATMLVFTPVLCLIYVPMDAPLHVALAGMWVLYSLGICVLLVPYVILSLLSQRFLDKSVPVLLAIFLLPSLFLCDNLIPSLGDCLVVAAGIFDLCIVGAITYISSHFGKRASPDMSKPSGT